MQRLSIGREQNMEAFSYDITQYESHPYAQTHPELMYTMGKLFGLKPTNFKKCRVLELGCAAGGNIMPLAYNFKDSEYVGVDLSAKQIEQGLEQIRDLGLTNIRLLHKSIMDIDSSYGKFDYIISHGVFSWVPKEVQDKMLEICRDNLTPNGIAYISYNTLPGWNMVKSIRELMLYHCQGFDTHQKKVEQARLILKFMVDSLEGQNNPYVNFLRSEVELLSKHNDYYLLHEHLEQENNPMYFHEFMGKAAQHDLCYLSDTQLSGMFVNNLPEKVSSQISKITDIVRLNQYMDFIRNQRFRCTLLCHKEVTINRALKPEDIENFYVSYLGAIRNDITEADLEEGKTLQFVGGTITLTLKHRISKIAMKIIHDRCRKPISFEKLVAQTKEQTGETDENKIKQMIHLDLGLMRLTLAGLIQLHSTSGEYTHKHIQKPKATKLAQYQAKKKNLVTNQRHELVALNPVESKLIAYCDGTKDVKKILEKMQEHFSKGELKLIQASGEEITQKDEIQKQADVMCNELLKKMANNALLVSE
jgi:methyltransferase-like protein/cyclopropane fatty-acyl-phospholipid synthase-like methyltransferase